MWATPSLPMGHRHELMSTAIRCKQRQSAYLWAPPLLAIRCNERQSAQRTYGLHRYWAGIVRGRMWGSAFEESTGPHPYDALHLDRRQLDERST